MYAVSSRFTEAGIRARAMQAAAAQKIDHEAQEAERQRRRIEAEEERVRRLEELAERQREAVAAIADANAVLQRMRGGSNTVAMATIVRRICRALKISRHDILSNRRSRDIVFARQAIMYWACRRTKFSLPEIGRRMGGKDHTTCLHGRDKYREKRAKMGRYLRPAR